MKKKFSTMKLQNRFLLILLLALTISATLFELLWLNKWTLVNWTGNFEILQSQIDDEDFWTKLDETAQNLSLPESSDDESAAKAIKPLLDLADKYTSIYLYEQEDGLYITGQYAKIMDEKHSGFRTFFDLGYRLTDGEGEDFRQGYLQFQNRKAQVVVVNYQRALFLYVSFATFKYLGLSWNRPVLHEPEDARSTGSGAGNFADVHRGSDPPGSAI